jgi:hypothetical protein
VLVRHAARNEDGLTTRADVFRQFGAAFSVVVAGVIVGIASSSSDHVPYLRSDQAPAEVAKHFATGVVNSVVVWFGIPLLSGYVICRSWRQAAVAGGAFMTAAILAYSAYGVYGPAERRTVDTEGFWAATRGLREELALAVVAGIVAGVLGFLAQRKPSLLLVVIPVVGAELVRRGEFSWRSDVGASENVFLIGCAAAMAVYVGIVATRRRSRMDLAPAER